MSFVKEILVGGSLAIILAISFSSCIDNKCLLRANTCQNGGECEEGVCNCPPGYFGEDCEYYEPCSVLVCENGGTCDEWDGQCDCLEGFEGELCETEERAEFLGSFVGYGTRTCQEPFATVSVSDIPFNIEPHPTELTKVLVHFDGEALIGQIDDSPKRITIYNQAVSTFYNYSGGVNTYSTEDSIYISIRKHYIQYDCRFNLNAALPQ